MSRAGRAAAFALVAALAAAVEVSAQTAPASRTLVMPFENVGRDSRLVWLGEASAVLLADDLNLLGTSAITRAERREAFDRLQVPPAASLTDATVIRIGQLLGAGQVVVGSLQMDGETLVVHARSIALEAGKIQANVSDRGAIPDLFAIFERVARQLAPSSGAADIERRHPPVAAFENYIKGLVAETPGTAINYLNAALQAAPTFDRVRLAMWDVYDDQGDHQRALDAVLRVPAGSEFYRRARFRAGLSQLNLKRYDDAFATFKTLADESATAPVLNNLGVVQLRRGSTAQTGTAAYYFTKASEADKSEPDYFFNLGYAYWSDRDTQAAIYWLREAVRRDPADGDAHFVLGAALTAAGNLSEAAREKELARRLSSRYVEWERRPAADPVPKGLERIKSDVELPHDRRIEETVASSGQRDQQALARFYLDRGRRLYQQENDRDAAAELNRALFLSPYEADAHLLLGRIHLRNGRVHEAIDAFKISLWSAESAAAHIALANAYIEAKEYDSARAEANRALALDPESADARSVLARIDRR